MLKICCDKETTAIKLILTKVQWMSVRLTNSHIERNSTNRLINLLIEP